jgi:hypothetical protein
MNAYRTNAYASPLASPPPSVPRLWPALAIAGAALALPMTLATNTGCGASSAQIQQTIQDGENLASCIIGTILGGVTDPVAIGTRCVGALPAVIADVIADVQAKDVAAQASLADGGAAAQVGYTSRERALFDEAKQKAAALVATNQKQKAPVGK